MSMEIIQLSGVEKSYETGPEELKIIRGVNLGITGGSVVVITGESGSGKSTLLNLIGGLDSPTGGEILVDHLPVHEMNEDELTEYRSSRVGFVFQFHYLMKDFTAHENVMIPAFIRGMRKTEALDRAAGLLARVGLEGRVNHYPAQLSGGERQRVAVARSLVNDPAVILADEPTGNLDEQNSRNVEDILFDLVRRVGKTLVLVTHDSHLTGYADSSYVLENGILCER